ncbi:MAG: hypothetical protein LBE25_15620 [Arthrobacter sp.]|jgi:hypothetical protein|nr:hypothetical protein [Arthrobacter sp.]
MKHFPLGKALVAAGGAALLLSATACQTDVACDTRARIPAVTVTFTGDDSSVDRVYACTPEVTECVVPRQPGDPIASRAPGPWTISLNTRDGRGDEVDIYAVDADNKVLKKERVKVAWATDNVDEKCGSDYSAAVTVKL